MSAAAASIDALDGSHPASDGAHRLAWWLCADDARWLRLTQHTPLSFAAIDDLLSGRIEPGETMATDIAHATGGAVLPQDWSRGGSLGWTDRPFKRPALTETGE